MPAEAAARSSLRASWLTLHRWLGLAVGAFFFIAASTGAVLVYEHELDTWINGGIYRVTSGDVGAERALAAGLAAMPGELLAMRWPSPREPVYTIEVRQSTGRASIRVDPGSGDVAAQIRRRWPILQLVRRTHTTLLAGMPGHYVVLGASTLALFSLITGSILWWPGLRRITHGFGVRTRRGFYPFNFDLHQVAGIVALPLLFLITLTGVLIPFPGPLERVLRLVLDDRPAAAEQSASATGSRTAAAAAGPSDLLRAAREAAPGADPVMIRLPTQQGQSARIELLRGPRGRASSTTVVLLDASDARVIETRDPRSADLARRIAGPLTFDLHVGAVGAPWVRPFYVLCCAIGAVLTVSGFFIWWLKRVRSATDADGRTATARIRAVA